MDRLARAYSGIAMYIDNKYTTKCMYIKALHQSLYGIIMCINDSQPFEYLLSIQNDLLVIQEFCSVLLVVAPVKRQHSLRDY